MCLAGLMLGFALFSCKEAEKIDAEAIKKEIVQMERAFRDDLQAKGAAYAFYTYAAPDAVIKRENDSLIMGKDGIKAYYSQPGYANATADWEADFTGISEDGSMAYTYGKYTWTIKQPDGNEQNFSGVFHTVWKRQPDGSWKYVWD